jgi:hypothetical protein
MMRVRTEWVGGEFYLASEDTIELAGQTFCDAATNDFNGGQQ